MRCVTRFRGRYGFLSNFYECEPFEYNGIWFTNVEAFFQSQKSKYIDDQKLFENISGVEAKKLSKTLFIRDDWDKIRLRVMRYGIRRKFEDTYLKELLMNTGDIKLYEGNWHGDSYWGVCLRTKKGYNKLGEMLMEKRTDFLNPVTKENFK